MSDTKALPDHDSAEQIYVLRLYVSGNSTRSTRAVQNLRAVCNMHLSERYSLEVIDIYQNPQAAREAQIVAVPTLHKLLPEPSRVLIGDLSDLTKLRAALDIWEVDCP